MKNLLLALFVFSCISCIRYDAADFLERQRTTTYTYNCPIVKIDTVRSFRNGQQFRRVDNTYDAQGRLIKIFNASTLSSPFFPVEGEQNPTIAGVPRPLK